MDKKQNNYRRFCPKGHDTTISGRDTGRGKECSECRRQRDKINNKRRKEYKRSWERNKMETNLIFKLKEQTRKRIYMRKRSNKWL